MICAIFLPFGVSLLDSWLMVNDQISRFSLLANMANDMASEDRRELLRKVTDAIGKNLDCGDDTGMARLDELLASAATDYALQVRADAATLVATEPIMR